MIFARRLMDSLRHKGAHIEAFYLRSRTSPRALLSEWRRFRRELERVRPSIVHAHFGSVTAIFAALAARGIPLVITYRGGDLNAARGSFRRRVRSVLARALSQLAALRAARIVCVSRQLRDRLWWRRDRAIVLPSGVDISAFVPEPRAAARSRLGWTLDHPVVLFNSSHDPLVKRLDLAHASVEAARRQIPALRLDVLDGMIAPSEVPTRMNAADCLLVTSDTEGSPTVVQEALACGLPIVSVAVGDVAERLAGVVNTCVVPRDPAAIGAAVVEMVREPRRTDGPARSAEFSTARIAEKLLALYDEI
jgi:glycosyltransferase involved in cell wall biosynthesis